MIIKKYIVDTLEEAEPLIRKELGPEAIILTSRTIKMRGFKSLFWPYKLEVIAGVESQKEPIPNQKAGEPLHASLQRLAGALQNQFGAVSPSFKAPQLVHRSQTDLLFFLIARGISHANACLIVDRMEDRYGKDGLRMDEEGMALLRKECASMIPIAGPILLQPNSPQLVAFAGAAGSGKTSMLIKIALQYRDDLGKRVGIISHADSRLGAIAYHQALCTSFSLPFISTTNPGSLRHACEMYQDCNLILIDTPGSGWNEALGQIAALPRLQLHLVISADMREKDALELTQHYHPFRIESLMFSKTDLTQTHGMLFNLPLQMGLGISYISTGPSIPADLLVADPIDVATLILPDSQ